MGPSQRILAAVLAACAVSCALLCPPAARASRTQQSILMDDDELIYSSPDHVAQRLRQIASLGVDRVKVSVVWSLLAPDADSTQRPNFDATDPSDYPPGAWDRYDTLVRLAHALGMSVYFQLSPPVPLWALPRHQTTLQGPVLGRAPSGELFRQFSEAVGRRYSGTYAAPVPASEPPPSFLGIPFGTASAATAPGTPVPRVDEWGIWNEPNERSWLNPWERNLGHGHVELLQPSIYRSLVDGAWTGLLASGHGGDTILVGETANVGIMTPIPFVRALYCVSSSLAPLRGESAVLLGCPRSGNRGAFRRAHPGLFALGGFAHHPYRFDAPPSQGGSSPNTITLANIGHFERTIDAILAGYGAARPGGLPIYMTEWGYKSRPPNPFVRTSLAQQATWLNQGEYMTWLDPRIQALDQFELVDSPPKPGERVGSVSYWSTFQTGLMLRNGTLKPSYGAFRIPIWLPVARHGSRVAVWGQLRPADHLGLQYGVIEWRPTGRAWVTLREVQTASPEGFVLAHVSIPAAGSVRLAWLNPDTGTVLRSRAVAVR